MYLTFDGSSLFTQAPLSGLFVMSIYAKEARASISYCLSVFTLNINNRRIAWQRHSIRIVHYRHYHKSYSIV